jgi:hypothetical protein
MLFGQLQQLARQARRQIEKKDVAKLVVEPADMLGQCMQDVQGKIGIVADLADELVTVESKRFGRFQSYGRGRPR